MPPVFIYYRKGTTNGQKSTNYKTKLPGGLKKIRDATNVVTRTLDHDLKAKKRVTPYSDKAFHRAAIEWLVATDQVRHICRYCHLM